MNGSRTRLGKKSKTFWKQIKMNSQHTKLMGHSSGSSERKVCSHTDIPKKYRNISNKQPNTTPTRTRGTTTKTARSKQKERNNQDHSRIK